MMRRIANNDGDDADSKYRDNGHYDLTLVENANESHHLPPSVLMLILRAINDSQLRQV
jgi:hypothetical protein